jgi:N-formylglutamate amidohydrolase
VLQGFGYDVRRNDPYAGGYVTRHYGRPRENVHALQIEIARRLYMDEATLQKSSGFEMLQARLSNLLAEISTQSGLLLGTPKKEGGTLRHRQV